jgi:salicylate hydroxylase
MRILIVGAGIGGLTAALALRQVDFEVEVYEQAAVLREVGAGLALGSNAVRVLERLGLGEALRAVGVASHSLDLRAWDDGAVFARLPLGEAAVARWGAPFYNVHRADLHELLCAALGDAHLTLGARCVGVAQHGGAVTLRFADGRQATGDLVIGADGIHSVVREYVAGPAEPIWWRQIAWRGLAPAAIGHAAGVALRQQIFMGPDGQFLTYYVADGRLVNWVGFTPSDGWREESWSARGDRDEALALFAGWHPEVRDVIAGTEAIFRWALFDRPPLETWTRGRVTLLGDAAHPMLPFRGQGAAQSIEDGFVLARCLAANRDDPEQAIAGYATRRRERTAALQAASREAGDSRQRSARMRADRAGQVADYDWVWGYDVERCAVPDWAG